jgi:hypothetical protein
MKRTGSIVIVLLLAVAGFGFLQQSSRAEVYYQEYLGFSLMPGANSTAVTFHIVRKWDDPKRPIEAVNISQAEFMRIACGFQESQVNPKKENLFAKYGLTDCGYFNDTVIKGRIYNGGMRCNTVEDLWRLRYGEWPFFVQAPRPSNGNTLTPQGPGPGWARKPQMPSEGQLEILKAYGVTDPMVDVIWGEEAFRLLKDMQDDAWVATYKSS